MDAGWGTDHPGVGCCRIHGGNSPSHQRAAAVQGNLVKAKRAVGQLGIGVSYEVDPREALLGELYRTAGMVSFYEAVINGEHPDYPEGVHLTTLTLYNGEQKSVWLNMYNEERDRLAKVSKMCIEVGLAERQIRIAETQAMMIVTVMRRIFDDLGISARPELAHVVRLRLQEVSELVKLEAS